VQPEASAAFFSYSREDSDFALRLAQDLRAAGANVWIDQLDIEPGQEWDSAIEAAVTQSSRMLLILSPASVKSRNVRNEISFALDENKAIVPVLYQDCTVPLQLHRVQYIDLRSDYSRGLTVLLRTLGVEQRAAAGTKAAMTEPRADEVVQQRSDKLLSKYPRWMKAVVALCPILIAASILYWNLPHSKERKAETQNQRTQAAQKKPAVTEPDSPPPSSLPAPNESSGQRQKTEVGTGGAKPASAEHAPRERRAVPQGGQRSNDQTAKVLSREGGASAANPIPSASSGVPAEGVLPTDLDPKMADVYRRAQSGDAMAMQHMGSYYEFQRGYARAVPWFRKAAEAGSTFGMTSLGRMLENGDGVDKDYNQAAGWYRKAAEAGDRDGMYYLGVLYERGHGVNQDQQQALMWYRKAAHLGLGDAQDALKRLGEGPK
jgi:hypothetical protein